MGFGTLFIGYVLLLSIAYKGLTDIIAAAVMLLGLYKLSGINRFFKMAAVTASAFLVFSLGELGVWTYEMFWRKFDAPLLISALGILRCVLIGALTVLILKGIEAVAKEVDLKDTPIKAKRLAIINAVFYAVWIVFELPLTFLNELTLARIYAIIILLSIALIIADLTVIYSCYMRICMPGDEDISREKPSRFGFVNEYRARKAEREREAAEERAKLIKERAQKLKGKKK